MISRNVSAKLKPNALSVAVDVDGIGAGNGKRDGSHSFGCWHNVVRSVPEVWWKTRLAARVSSAAWAQLLGMAERLVLVFSTVRGVQGEHLRRRASGWEGSPEGNGKAAFRFPLWSRRQAQLGGLASGWCWLCSTGRAVQSRPSA